MKKIDQRFKPACDKIWDLNLAMVKRKLQQPVYMGGANWSEEVTDTFDYWYRCFLALKVAYRAQKIVPTHEIDEFWHAHILDTFHYHEDTCNIFGAYLHHDPYYGMRNQKEADQMNKDFLATMQLFKTHFGSQPPALHNNAQLIPAQIDDDGANCA